MKQNEGAITKDEVEFFVDEAKSKKIKKVSLLFYDKSKANAISKTAAPSDSFRLAVVWL
ncbi:hypothetical protein NSS79_10010 [Paenibacillus sp. FSL L8-0436]|uniref:hypothetical protein n=1 Tax=Paenibacillus sp. FSL L8-0436 TaxID=2954686 RepID=UPI003158B70C